VMKSCGAAGFRLYVGAPLGSVGAGRLSGLTAGGTIGLALGGGGIFMPLLAFDDNYRLEL
jgi:hypothetical protein